MAGAAKTAPAERGEASAPLAPEHPAGERIDRSRPIRQRLVLRADAAPVRAEGTTGAAHTATLAIASAIRAAEITTAAPEALRHGPVMLLAAVQTFATDWHGWDEG